MPKFINDIFADMTIRQQVRLVAFVVLGASIVVLLHGVAVRLSTVSYVAPDVALEPEQVAGELARSAPVELSIPAIALQAAFEGSLGVNPDGTMEVPVSYDDLGWYQYGPTPGELGPAVVVGHVDSFAGPAVFYRLGELTPGDEIIIDRADGTTATFVVTGLERFAQDSFPTALIYSDLDYPGLRLITCSGVFDQGTLRYTHNLVVFAALVEPEEAEEVSADDGVG